VKSGLRVEDRGPVRLLTLDRPARKNALNRALLEALAEAVDPNTWPKVRCLVVRGHGGVFCAGYDLNELPKVTANGPLPDEHLGEVLDRLARHPAPSVAAVTGPAFGAGFELACACDFRLAGADARFCMPPVRLGLVYAPSGLARVQALVGLAKAKLLFLTGRTIDSDQALAWGLVDERVSDVEKATQRLCAELVQGAPLATRGTKRSFQLLGQTLLGESARTELRRLRREAFASADAREARAAFLAKRSARFVGR